jgi:hypothetical protein
MSRSLSRSGPGPGSGPGSVPVTVAVITDSTAHLPQSMRDRHAITVVPLTVVVDGEALEDGTAEAAQRLVPALRQHRPVTTSRPSGESPFLTFSRLGSPVCESASWSSPSGTRGGGEGR